MKKPPGIKVRSYAACIIDLNEYLSVLPGAKESDKICEMELKEILLNRMTNICIRQEYMQRFNY